MRVGRTICIVVLAGCVGATSAEAQVARATMKDASGKEVGRLELVQTPLGVLVKLSLKGAVPGEHAFHVHAVGKCEVPFTSAGGHFNPAAKKHGMAEIGRAHV